MQCSHASTLKLIDWLVRCHGQAGEAGRAREAERWRERYGYCLVEDETYTRVCLCVGVLHCWNAHALSRTRGRMHTNSWPALAWFWSVALGHGEHRSQLSAFDGLIQAPLTPLPPPQHSQTSTSIPQSFQPFIALLLLLLFLFSSQPMPGGHVWEETYWRVGTRLHIDPGCTGTCPIVTLSQPPVWHHILAVLATNLWSRYLIIWLCESSLLKITLCFFVLLNAVFFTYHKAFIIYGRCFLQCRMQFLCYILF